MRPPLLRCDRVNMDGANGVLSERAIISRRVPRIANERAQKLCPLVSTGKSDRQDDDRPADDDLLAVVETDEEQTVVDEPNQQ